MAVAALANGSDPAWLAGMSNKNGQIAAQLT